MRKLIKKSLAICLVAALSLTLFAGALSANAEDALTGTITAGTANVEVGATEVTVPVTIESAAINTAKIAVSSDFGAVTAIATETAACKTIEDINGGTFLIEAKDNVAGFTSAVINVTFTADAAPAAGEYAVAIELVEVHAANWDEAVITLTPAAGKIVVAEPAAAEPAIDYSTASYDLAANKLVVNYTKPSAEVIKLLTAYNANKDRITKLVVDVNGTEFLFDAGLKSGGGYFEASGFALSHINQNVKVYIRISSPSLDLPVYNFNAYEIVIADFLAEQAGDAKVDAWLALNEVWAAGNETIAITNATIGEGYADYTAITYDTSNSKITINYAAPSTEFKNAFVGANSNGKRVAKLVVDVNGTEFLFDAGLKSGGGYFEASGFSLTHFNLPVKMYLRVSNETGLVFETNAVEVNLDAVMKAAEGSAFATAYAAYANS